MAVRSRTAGVLLALVGSVGFMRGDTALAETQAPSVVAETTAEARRITIRQRGVVLGTLEIPAGVSFRMSTRLESRVTRPRLDPTTAVRDSEPPRSLSTAVDVARRHYLVLSADDRSAAFTLETVSDTTLTVEP